jgi:hypothetical protein
LQRKIYSPEQFFGQILIFCPMKNLRLIQGKNYPAKNRDLQFKGGHHIKSNFNWGYCLSIF